MSAEAPAPPHDAIGELTVNDEHRGWICKGDMILATASKTLGPFATATDVLIGVDHPSIKPGDRVIVFPIRADE